MSASRNIRPIPAPASPPGVRKSPAAAVSSISTGRTVLARVGKYEVESEIGGGALIRVFQGWDRATGRRVILKVLTDIADAQRVERFRREVAALANVRDAHVISIYELGEHVGLPFAALEYLGDDHVGRAIAAPGRFTLLDKMRIMWQIAEGVQAAHRGGLAFVGLRPEGIVLCADGSAKVQDFGIVRAACDAPDALGHYAETSDGGHPDARSDVFAYGVIYYELLTGTLPMITPTGAPAPLRSLVADYLGPLEQLVGRALEPDRELRYQSLEDIQYDAEPILRELERGRAAVLVEQARHDLESQAVDESLAAVREALELDPANSGAQSLRGELRVLVQERAARTRLEGILSDAAEEIGRRHFDRAAELLESATRLEAGHPELAARFEETRARLAQGRETDRLLGQARLALEQKDLSGAQDRVLQALEREPECAEALELAEAISHAIRRRENEAHVEQGIAKVRSLLLLESFDAAVEILSELEAQCPGSPAVGQWLSYISVQREQAERQRRLEGDLEAARSLMGQQSFEEAAGILEGLRSEFPNETAISNLLSECWAESERTATIGEARSQCDALCRTERFDQALAVLDAAAAAYPGDADLKVLRREVEQRRREFESASAIRGVLTEAQWLLDQNRVDLAVQLLREKSAAMPDQPALAARLAGVEQMRATWEKRRLIEESLRRAASLAEAQQWPVALTVIEEALATYTESGELQEAAERLRLRLKEQGQQKKLARAAAGIRQSLADGDVEQAEQALERSLTAFPGEPALLELREELARDKKFREELRAAQVLVAKRQFEEAEKILVRLDSQRSEVQTLLRTVREARAASEEQGFYNRSREKAQHLLQQGQAEQAADLLRNLLALFPGDPILQRDLRAIPVARAAEPKPEPAVPAASAPPVRPAAASRLQPVLAPPTTKPDWLRRWPVLAGVGFVLLVTAGAAVKGVFGNAPAKPVAAAKKAVATPAPAVAAAPQPVVTASAPAPPHINEEPPPPAAKPGKPVKTAEPEPVPAPVRKVFNTATLNRPAVAQPATALPAPPAAATLGSVESSWMPAVVSPAVRAPAPPRETPAPNPPSAPAAAPPARVGGDLQPVRPISVPPPAMPQIAKERRITGVVTLSATVNQQGAVTNVKVTAGNPILAPAALEAVKHWRYQPAQLDGKPVDSEIRIEMRFESGTR